MDLLIPIIVILNLSYLYFWVITIYARTHGHIASEPVSRRLMMQAFVKATKRKHPRTFVIQITTKGGNFATVSRGIDEVLAAMKLFPLLRRLVTIEVVTESAEDVAALEQRYRHVKAYLLPASYQTPNGTKLKARALQYMVEQHRLNPRNGYVIHYDEESVYTPANLARLVTRLLNKPIGISEGSISYGLDYMDAALICRTMEANRPFGCHECFLMMTRPVPLHLHGSNLVIQEELENEIGWDIGTYRGNPLIAEDLVFGLMAYMKFGKQAFGWHGVEMIEQPPFTAAAAYKQRERWIMGALQGVAHASSLPGWSRMSWLDRLKVNVMIRARVVTYALGFPVSAVTLFLWGTVGFFDAFLIAIGAPPIFGVSWLGIPGLLMWVGSTQLGLAQNLRYAEMTAGAKVREHFKVLLMTPVAGLVDTFGPLMATLKWLCGYRSVNWIPTPKLALKSLSREDGVL